MRQRTLEQNGSKMQITQVGWGGWVVGAQGGILGQQLLSAEKGGAAPIFPVSPK